MNKWGWKDCSVLENNGDKNFKQILDLVSVAVLLGSQAFLHFQGGSFLKPVIYPLTYLNWIFDSIYLSNLFKPSSCEGGDGHSEVSVGRWQWNIIQEAGSKYIPRYQGREWYFQVVNDTGDISSPPLISVGSCFSLWAPALQPLSRLPSHWLVHLSD